MARLRDGDPIERLAALAGLTVAEWEAIEAGQVPDSWEQVCLMAAALYMSPQWKAYLAKLYAGAVKK